MNKTNILIGILLFLIGCLLVSIVFLNSKNSDKINSLDKKADSLELKINELNSLIQNNTDAYLENKKDIILIKDSLNILKNGQIDIVRKYQKAYNSIVNFSDDEQIDFFTNHIK